MTAKRHTFIQRFLNIFTLMHFDYFDDAEKELNEIVSANDTHKDINHAKPIANLVLNWVADTKQEQKNV